MGAWIEILYPSFRNRTDKSLLSWERGLKCNIADFYKIQEIVAPLVGAWIEITWLSSLFTAALSLLSWERGLKCYYP